MPLWEKHVERKVDSALHSLEEACGRIDLPPVHIELLPDALGIRLERRNMIPEGMLCVEERGLRIVLQANFEGTSAAKRRQRFTLAHEIAHSFFYEVGVLPPRPIRKAPTDALLEHLCNYGASLLLVPNKLAKEQIPGVGLCSVDEILGLAKAFDVSAEVMMRALGRSAMKSHIRSGYAIVLVDTREAATPMIVAAVHDGWLSRHTRILPQRGTGFEDWVAPLLANRRASGAGWLSSTDTGDIEWRERKATGYSYFLELKEVPRLGVVNKATGPDGRAGSDGESAR